MTGKQIKGSEEELAMRRCLFQPRDKGQWFCREGHKLRNDAGSFGMGFGVSYATRGRRPS